MKKIRTLSFGIVIAAGMAMFGTGIAVAEETPPATTQPEVGGTEDEATTGSAAGLAALIQALTTGSAAAEDTDVDAVADEVPPATGGTENEATTGSADSLAAILKALTTGSAAAEETPVETAPAA
ncbi:hypothetical protein [Nocardia salmonicida]|uniref:hypothetical protein n=1 Tax=Nocardia salmonicida TaxID=53431 RepID=UPI003409F37C